MSTVLAPDGLVRPVIFGQPVGALDAAAVCVYFTRSPENAAETIAALKRQPGFPSAIKPWGARGHERWNIEELDAWRLNHCPRASDVSPRRWAPDDPRRIRATARANRRQDAAPASGMATEPSAEAGSIL